MVITSELVNHRRRDAGSADEEDPRLARALSHNVLVPEKFSVRERRVLLTYVTRSSRMRLGCGMDHVVATECAFSSRTVCDDPGHGAKLPARPAVYAGNSRRRTKIGASAAIAAA